MDGLLQSSRSPEYTYTRYNSVRYKTGQRTHQRWRIKTTIWVLLFFTFLPSSCVPTNKLAVMHYGDYGGLNLSCSRGELIQMVSQQLGYNISPDLCNPDPLCSVEYPLARWYCRGKTTCSGVPVERRPLHKRTCGSHFTNCLRVEYKCVPQSDLLDMCRDKDFYSSGGHLVSPSFPDMYPPDKDCTCVLTAEPPGQVMMFTILVILKAERPCLDWLRVTVDGLEENNLCGYVPNEKIYMGRRIDLNFLSDLSAQELGFWLKYESTIADGQVRVSCGVNAKSDYINQYHSLVPGIQAYLDNISKLTVDVNKEKELRDTGINTVNMAALITTKSPAEDHGDDQDVLTNSVSNVPNPFFKNAQLDYTLSHLNNSMIAPMQAVNKDYYYLKNAKVIFPTNKVQNEIHEENFANTQEELNTFDKNVDEATVSSTPPNIRYDMVHHVYAEEIWPQNNLINLLPRPSLPPASVEAAESSTKISSYIPPLPQNRNSEQNIYLKQAPEKKIEAEAIHENKIVTEPPPPLQPWVTGGFDESLRQLDHGSFSSFLTEVIDDTLQQKEDVDIIPRTDDTEINKPSVQEHKPKKETNEVHISSTNNELNIISPDETIIHTGDMEQKIHKPIEISKTSHEVNSERHEIDPFMVKIDIPTTTQTTYDKWNKSVSNPNWFRPFKTVKKVIISTESLSVGGLEEKNGIENVVTTTPMPSSTNTINQNYIKENPIALFKVTKPKGNVNMEPVEKLPVITRRFQLQARGQVRPSSSERGPRKLDIPDYKYRKLSPVYTGRNRLSQVGVALKDARAVPRPREKATGIKQIKSAWPVNYRRRPITLWKGRPTSREKTRFRSGPVEKQSPLKDASSPRPAGIRITTDGITEARKTSFGSSVYIGGVSSAKVDRETTTRVSDNTTYVINKDAAESLRSFMSYIQQMNPVLYAHIQNNPKLLLQMQKYIYKNSNDSDHFNTLQPQAIKTENTDPNKKASEFEKSSTNWILVVVAALGWLVFALVLAALIQSKRSRMRRPRRKLAATNPLFMKPTLAAFPPTSQSPISRLATSTMSTDSSMPGSLGHLINETGPIRGRRKDPGYRELPVESPGRNTKTSNSNTSREKNKAAGQLKACCTNPTLPHSNVNTSLKTAESGNKDRKPLTNQHRPVRRQSDVSARQFLGVPASDVASHATYKDLHHLLSGLNKGNTASTANQVNHANSIQWAVNNYATPNLQRAKRLQHKHDDQHHHHEKKSHKGHSRQSSRISTTDLEACLSFLAHSTDMWEEKSTVRPPHNYSQLSTPFSSQRSSDLKREKEPCRGRRKEREEKQAQLRANLNSDKIHDDPSENISAHQHIESPGSLNKQNYGRCPDLTADVSPKPHTPDRVAKKEELNDLSGNEGGVHEDYADPSSNTSSPGSHRYEQIRDDRLNKMLSRKQPEQSPVQV